MKTLKLSFIFILTIFFFCISNCTKREYNNPFDKNCPKEYFDPSDFKGLQQGNSIKLSWQQTNANITGFIINRNENDNIMAEVAKINKSDSIWFDNDIVEGKKYGYQLIAYAGENLSNPQSIFVVTEFLPTVTTSTASNITTNSAQIAGEITSIGAASVSARGICWSTTQEPTIQSPHTDAGNGLGSFISSLTGLNIKTTYFARAYAIAGGVTVYGNEVSFKTLSDKPPPEKPENISATPVDMEVTIKWAAVDEASSYNIYWSTTPDVSKTNYEGKNTDIAETTYLHAGLTSGTTYYYVATAENEDGESSESSVARATLPLLFQTDNMSALGEKHYYQVTVSSGQSLFVTTNKDASVNSYYLYVKYDSLPTTADYDAKSETGSDEAITITNTQSGTYYIMVYVSKFNILDNRNYSITVSTSTIDLTLGTTYDAGIVHGGEKDYYEVTLSSGQSFLVNMHKAATVNHYFLYVKYGSLPTTLDYDAKSETGEDEAINISNTQSGTYYIMVYVSKFNILDNRYYNIKASLW